MYIHFISAYILEKSNFLSFSASRWSLLMQHPMHVLQIMSPASPGDARVESSLMCLGRKGTGGKTH